MERAESAKAHVETMPGFADAEKAAELNSLAGSIKSERDELHGIYRTYGRLTHQITDETRQAEVPSNAELVA